VSSTSSELKGSAVLLTGANVVCGLIGVSQGLVVLRLLGPEPFGAAAVVVALATVAVNLVDVRLTDLISKLYYDARACDSDDGTAYRAGVLRLGLKLYSCGGVLITAVAILALSVGAHRFAGIELRARGCVWRLRRTVSATWAAFSSSSSVSRWRPGAWPFCRSPPPSSMRSPWRDSLRQLERSAATRRACWRPQRG
jgi:hypothetical protein